MTNDTEAQKTAENQLLTLFDTIYELNYNIFTIMSEQNSQVAKGSDLYRVDKSTKLCMVVA